MSTHCYYCDNKNVVGLKQQCLNPDFHYCSSDFVEYHKRRIMSRVYRNYIDATSCGFKSTWTEEKGTQTDAILQD